MEKAVERCAYRCILSRCQNYIAWRRELISPHTLMRILRRPHCASAGLSAFHKLPINESRASGRVLLLLEMFDSCFSHNRTAAAVQVWAFMRHNHLMPHGVISRWLVNYAGRNLDEERREMIENT